MASPQKPQSTWQLSAQRCFWACLPASRCRLVTVLLLPQSVCPGILPGKAACTFPCTAGSACLLATHVHCSWAQVRAVLVCKHLAECLGDS